MNSAQKPWLLEEVSSESDSIASLNAQQAKQSTLKPILSIAFGTALIAAAGYVVWRVSGEIRSVSFSEESANTLGFFALINLNIVVVLILGFLVTKNVIKLLLDRRRKILGSRLRTRLVVAFVGLSLIPTILLFSVARGILERVLEGWFSPQVQSAVEGSLAIAKAHYESQEASLVRQSKSLTGAVTTGR